MSANETTPTASAASPTPLDHPSPSTVYLRSLSKTSSTPVIDTTSTDYECYKFEGQEFEFPDQSRWLISRPLSDMVIQQTCSPAKRGKSLQLFAPPILVASTSVSRKL
jgi:hypothetical protein